MPEGLKLYRRADSGDTWHYRGTVAGRRLRGSTKTTDKEIAARTIARIEQQTWDGHFDGPASVLTFPQAAELYTKAGKSDRFLEKIEDHFKDTLIKDITAGAIRQAAVTLFPNTSGATRNRQVIVPAQAVINHCAELELCQHIKVRRFKVETKVKTPATLEWVEAFMKASPPHLGGLALFMFLTGARISEALRIERERDLDLRAGTVIIRDTKTGKERKAHLPRRLVIALAGIKQAPNRTLFLYTAKAAAQKSWRAAVKRAGIEPLSFHCCRHGFATALLRAGVDVITVAKLGGWSDAAHVFKTYGHAVDDPTLTDRIADTELTRNVFEIVGNASAGRVS